MTDLILYTTEDGKIQIKLRTKDQTVLLTQREMAELFDVSTDNVGLHLKNTFEDGELSREATTEESSVVQTVGTRQFERPVTLYCVDSLITAATQELETFKTHKKGLMQQLFPSVGGVAGEA